MSGKVVPATNIYLKTAPGTSNNSVFQVFGTPTGNNLVGLVGLNYDSGARPPPDTALTVPTAASGNLKLSFFGGKSVFLAAPTTCNISSFNVSSNKLTTDVSGGGGTSFYVLVGTTDKGSNVLSNVVSGTDLGSLIDLVSNTYYYISAYGSNATNGTASLLVSNTRFTSDKAAAPTGVSASAVSVSGLTPTWTDPAGNATTDWYMRIGSNNNESNIADNVSVVVNTVKAITLPSNVKLYMAMAVVNAKGTGSYSTFAGPYLTSKPSLAPSVTPTSATTTKITATITQASAENGTESFLATCGTTSAANELVSPATTIASGTAFPSTGFTTQSSNTLIYLAVASSNSKGVGAYSTAVSYPTSLPASATISALSGTTSNISFKLTGASGNATTGYSAVIGAAVGGTGYVASFAPSPTDSSTAITKNFTANAITNKFVYVTVYQSNAIGSTATSSSYTSSVANAPTSVSASGVSASGLTPTWTDPEGDATIGYKIRIGTGSSGTALYNIVDGSAVNKDSDNLYTISSNVYIYLSIAVSNAKGVGTYGTGTTSYLTSAPSGAPTVTITDASLTTLTATLAHVGTENGSTGFKALYGTDAPATNITNGTAVTVSSGTAFPSGGFTSVGSNNLIYLKVASTNSKGTGSYSTPQGYPSTVPPVPSLSITQSSVSISNLGSVTITAPSGNATSASGYKLTVGTTIGGSELASFTGLTTTAFTSNFTTNTASNTYIYVTAYASNLRGYGDSLASNSIISSRPGAPTVTVTTGTTTIAAAGNVDIIMPIPTWTWTWVGNVPTTSEVLYYSGTLTWVSFGSATTFTSTTPQQINGIAYDYFIPNLQYAPLIRLTNSRGIGNSGSNSWSPPIYFFGISNVVGNITTKTYNSITICGDNNGTTMSISVQVASDCTLNASFINFGFTPETTGPTSQAATANTWYAYTFRKYIQFQSYPKSYALMSAYDTITLTIA